MKKPYSYLTFVLQWYKINRDAKYLKDKRFLGSFNDKHSKTIRADSLSSHRREKRQKTM